MNPFLEDVKLFHIKFKSPVLDTPTANIPETRAELRLNLIYEEFKELLEAIQNKDIVAIADALCDLQYVLSGTVLEFGLGEQFDNLFKEVQRSNMSKSCIDLKEAMVTIDHYQKQDVVSYFEQNEDGTFNIYRTGDNKLLKSINYSPANLKQFIK